jgi:UDP-2,3-diacylglucosamine pyrophosphatase LpxH
MCPQPSRDLLAEFFGRLPKSSADEDVHLVIAGDIVDFLAERDFRAFNSDAEARDKLQRIMAATADIWEALGKFVREGGALTLLLGNHDIELSLPQTRQTFLEAIGPGRVRFLYDNEAFFAGDLLIEHVTRYDGWNAVAHGSLRRVRSRLSRGLPPGSFLAMPGSQLVIDVMNPLKEDYSFVDLLKPEDAGVLPILAALGAANLSAKWKFMKEYRNSQSVDFDEEYQPKDGTYDSEIRPEELDLYKLAQDIAAGGDVSQASTFSLAGAREAVGEMVRALRRAGLKRAFQSNLVRNAHGDAFELSEERTEYITAAKAARKRGFKTIVFGHTHLPKSVPLDEGGLYLNTGTWADVIRVPKAVWGDDFKLADVTLNAFVDDLESDNVSRWRRSMPTYARIEMEDESVKKAGLYFAENDKEVTDAGIEEKLSPKGDV